MRIDQVGWLNNAFALVNLGTVILIIVLLLSMAKTFNSMEYVYLHYDNHTGFPFFYVILLSFTNAGYVLTGYEASTYLAEETSGSKSAAANGILRNKLLIVYFHLLDIA